MANVPNLSHSQNGKVFLEQKKEEANNTFSKNIQQH